jgi:hypothetical protein
VNVAFQRSKTTPASSAPGSKRWQKAGKGLAKAKAQPEQVLGHPESATGQPEIQMVIPQPQTLSTEYDTPDRLSGYEALAELRQTCEDRVWRFVEVNVTYDVSLPARVCLTAPLTCTGVPRAPPAYSRSYVSRYYRNGPCESFPNARPGS